MSIRKHRGQYTRDDIARAMTKCRISPENREIVTKYLVDGKLITQLGCTKQQAYPRIKKILKALGH